jgi:predicted enzyme related to lactoylglutathione lyase
MSEHRIVHVELPAASGKEASRFYNEAFGWKDSLYADADYYMFDLGDGTGGGFNKLTDEGNIPVKPGDVLVYISTDDIEESLAKVESLGGKTILGRTPVADMGAFAFFADPTGNRIGLWQTAGMPTK